MNKNLTNLFVFATGAVIGSFATWVYVNKKYELLPREEDEDLDEYYERCEEYSNSEEETTEEPDDEVRFARTSVKPNIMEYAKRVQDAGYVDYSNNAQTELKLEPEGDVERPYVISPEEFGEVGYSTMSLTYYNDKVLTDEDGDVITDVDDIVGLDSLETFGDYEEDSVFVRDDRRKTDYEILADPRNYSDVFKSNPHLTEDE